MFFMSFMFMFPMFMLSGIFAFEFAGLVVGLGDAVTIVFELALLFEFSAVVHAAPKTARANNARIPVVCLISVPPLGVMLPSTSGDGHSPLHVTISLLPQ